MDHVAPLYPFIARHNWLGIPNTSSCGTSPISERFGCRLIVPVHLGYDGLSDGVCYHDPLDFDVGGEPTHLMEPYKVGARALMTPCQL